MNRNANLAHGLLLLSFPLPFVMLLGFIYIEINRLASADIVALPFFDCDNRPLSFLSYLHCLCEELNLDLKFDNKKMGVIIFICFVFFVAAYESIKGLKNLGSEKNNRNSIAGNPRNSGHFLKNASRVTDDSQQKVYVQSPSNVKEFVDHEIVGDYNK